MNPALRPDFCEIVSDMKEHRKTYSAAITNGYRFSHFVLFFLKHLISRLYFNVQLLWTLLGLF